MDIVTALWCEAVELRTTEDGPAALDLGLVRFSLLVSAQPPTSIAPQLVVLIRARSTSTGRGALEVRVRDDLGHVLAEGGGPFTVEPGKMTYRLVRPILPLVRLGLVEAHCRIDGGPVTTAPLHLVPPAG